MDYLELDPEIKSRIVKRMSEIDSLPEDVRALVHEYGWSIVKAFRDTGVTKAKNIQHLIRMVQNGSTEGKVRPLIFADDVPSYLASKGMIAVPKEPTDKMLAASMAEVSSFNVHCTKEEKHQRRLRAAMAAGKITLMSDPMVR